MNENLKIKYNDFKQVGDYSILPFYRYSYRGNSMVLCQKNGCSLFCSDRIADQIEEGNISQELGLKLISRGFAYVKGSPKQVIDQECIEPRFFLIDMTNECNLSCSYCFRVPEQECRVISVDQVDRICEYILHYCVKHRIRQISIQPWGGEPLLCMNEVVRIRQFFQAHNEIDVDITLETNGTLLTERNLRLLKENKIRISISVDGPPSIHDMQRRTKNGNTTADLIKHNMKLAKSYGFEQLGGICILTRNSIGRISEILHYMAEDLDMSSIKLNLMRQPAYDCLEVEPLSESEIPAMAEEIIEAVSEMRRCGIRIVESNTRDRLLNLVGKKNNNICNSKGCCGGRKMVSFDMDGNIYPCELTDWEDECLGNISDSRDLSELIYEAIKNKPYFRKKQVTECDCCPFWYFCQGGCSSSIKYKHLKMPYIDTMECAWNKAIYPLLIKKLLTREAEKEAWI